MSNLTTTAPQPLASCIGLDSGGQPFLQGFRCASCHEMYLESRRGCPKCAAVNALQAARLSDHGRLFSYTIVHRSFPRVKTPFISAVVELAGGGYLKGNLEGVSPDPAQLAAHMPVQVRFERLAGAGGPPDLLRYFFVPMEDSRE